jgi:hypothetical protein
MFSRRHASMAAKVSLRAPAVDRQAEGRLDEGVKRGGSKAGETPSPRALVAGSTQISPQGHADCADPSMACGMKQLNAVARQI